ncbi:MAG: phage virion morphogenesis protein [Treponemataceae bacterium]
MSGATVTIDLREIETLGELLNHKALTSNDRQSLLKSIGLEMVEQSKTRITETNEAPSGEPWAWFAESTLKFLNKHEMNTSLLLREGELLGSLKSELKNEWSILVGACKEYAAVHQFGYDEKNIPARPYIGLSTENIDDLVVLTENWLQEKLK